MIIILAGCKSVANYQSELQVLVGQSEQQLESQWGIPSSIVLSGNIRLLTYYQNDGAYLAGGYWGRRVVPLYCNTTFTVQNGVVIQAKFVGNECTAE